MSFTRWLRQQRQRRDAVGDLARDQQYDTEWPKGPTKPLEVYREYLRGESAVMGAEEALVQAWFEWRREPTPSDDEIARILWPPEDDTDTDTEDTGDFDPAAWDKDCATAALHYRMWYGWCVLPAHYTHPPNQWHADPWCTCQRGRHCDKSGKHPVGLWNERDVPGPRSVDWLARQWSVDPRYNIALLTGKRSHVVVADVDPRHGGRIETLWDLGWPEDTVIARTGGGGWHVYAECPWNGLVSVDAYAEGIELKGNGKLVIVPPSVHPSGNPYEWHSGCAPWDMPLASLPRRVLADLAARRPEQRAGTLIAPTTPVELTAAQLWRLRVMAIRKVANAVERARNSDDEGRHNTGLWLACQLRDLYLPLADRERCMRAYQKELEAIRVGR